MDASKEALRKAGLFRNYGGGISSNSLAQSDIALNVRAQPADYQAVQSMLL